MALRWGVLGTGSIAGSMTRDLQGAGLTVAAVGSRSADSARAFADAHRIPGAHASYEALCADPAVDAVYVATPHPFHAEHALLAVAHGKHALVEKPFTMDAASARAVFAAADARGVMVMEAMWTRFLPKLVRIRELVASGALGEVRAVIADHTQSLPTDPEHRLQNPRLGGGALLDLGIYPLTLADDVLGAPTAIAAQADFTRLGVDRQTGMQFRYDSGAQAQLLCALDTAGPIRAAIIGTDGSLELDRPWHEAAAGFTWFDAEHAPVERIPGEQGLRGMHYQALEFERIIASGGRESPILPPSVTVRIMETMDRVREQIGLEYPAV